MGITVVAATQVSLPWVHRLTATGVEVVPTSPMGPVAATPVQVVETAETSALRLCEVLARLHEAQPRPLTLVLVPPTDRRAQRLASLCKAVAVIAADTFPLATLVRLVQLPIQRPPTPSWIGLTPPPMLVQDPSLLWMLPALMTLPTMEAVAQKMGVTDRTLRYKLTAMREPLGLPARLAPPYLVAMRILEGLAQ